MLQEYLYSMDISDYPSIVYTLKHAQEIDASNTQLPNISFKVGLHTRNSL